VCGSAAQAQSALPSGPDTCVRGYVWREASSSDLVCVLPASRTLVKRENAAAPNLYVIAHTPLAF